MRSFVPILKIHEKLGNFQRGATLIETLVAVGLLGVAVTVSTTFMGHSNNLKKKIRIRHTMESIAQDIKNNQDHNINYKD